MNKSVKRYKLPFTPHWFKFHFGSGSEPRIIKKTYTEPNVEKVKKVIVASQHNRDHEKYLVKSRELSETLGWGKEQKNQSNFNEKCTSNTQLL